MRSQITPDARGRLLLPAEIRKSLGVDRGRDVSVEVRRDGSVVLRDPQKVRAAAIKRLRGSARGSGGTVDELLANRRREVELEAAKEARLGGGT